MKIKFLGTSSGEAIPRTDCSCQQCQSREKFDKRLRSAILVDRKILVDAGPDIAKELRPSQIRALEIVLITHDHQDHIGGIKDLLRVRRDLRIIRLRPGQHFKLLGVDVYAFRVRHSNVIPTVGVELGNALYLPDTADLDSASKYLKETKVAILDGSVLGRSFGGHLAIDEIIGETKEMKNLKKIYFTHNGHTHKTHKEMEKLVKSMGDSRYRVAYDGLEIEV
jgi:phosphoribosyl 1,2-cyclic phosphate phosphodiesterase